ncbi:MAG: RHS repeat protein, partial [Candidatus Omnitrophica bacterium]|nr:RHS repeat protein [Candidatus Omnitrophota bacterium]
MKEKTLKIISIFTLLIFTFTTLIPPSFASIIVPPIGLPCWNDGSIASATGGDDGLGPEGDLNNRGLDREADPVILSKGNFVHQRQDLFIPSRGLPLEINRIYNTQSKLEGPFGIGWSHNYDTHLIQVIENTETYILRRNPDGSKDRFLDNLDGTYETITPGCYDTLLKYETLPPEYSQIAPVGLNSSFHIRTKHGTDYLFDISGKLRVIADRNKNKITLQYDVNEKLTQIYDTLNRTLDLTYNTNNKIIEITDFSGRRFTYKYDTNQNLISAATPGTIDYPLGLTTTYTYDTKNNVTSISDPKNNTYLANIYDSNGMVIEQTYGADKFYFQYFQALDSSDKFTVFTDRNNNKIDYYFNEDGTTYKKLEYTQQLRPEDPEYYETLYEYNVNRETT